MKKNNIVFEKSKAFALRIVLLYKHFSEKKNERVLSKQLLRSGTSIGANLSEAICAVSRAGFLNKVHIAYKECNETRYWLALLKESGYLTEKQYKSIIQDADELFFLLAAITKSTQDGKGREA